MELSKELVAASAEPLLLSILAQEESYGYALIKSVQALSGGHVRWTEGMLYPVLHKLERQGLIESFWRAGDGGRKRKYYKVREAGMTRLKERVDQWLAVNAAITAGMRLADV